jgi:hypothetical protein
MKRSGVSSSRFARSRERSIGGSCGLARGQLEDAHRREEGWNLVEREVLPQHPVSDQPCHEPSGEYGPRLT